MMWWTWTLAQALAQTPCAGDPVAIGRRTYTYRESGACGSGRWAECRSEHTLGRAPHCTQATLTEWFGGGTSTRHATLVGEDEAARHWLVSHAGKQPRGDGPEDLLAFDPPTLTPSTPEQTRTAQTTRWLAGPPKPPRISWVETPCSDLAAYRTTEDATCLRVFRGDQVTPQRVDPIDEHTELHVLSNTWRNVRVFYVVYDRRENRHAFVAKTMVFSLGDVAKALPKVVARHGGGLVLEHGSSDAMTVVAWVRPDGSYAQIELDGRPTPDGAGWTSKAGETRTWSAIFAPE